MRKPIKLLLCTMLCLSILLTIAGCGSSNAPATETSTAAGNAAETSSVPAAGTPEKVPTGTIEFWSMLTQEERATQLQKLADDYVAAHAGTKINITVMPWTGALDKIVAAIMAGNAPDLFTTGGGYPQSLAGTGGLLEFSELIKEVGGTESFMTGSLDIQGASEDGGLYSIPLYITPYIAYYRQSWLDAAGVTKLPGTWEEYYDMCKAVTKPAENKYGFGIPLGDLHGWKTIWSFLQSNEVDLINKDSNGKWYVDLEGDKRAAAVETYNYLYKLVKDCSPEGVISYTQTNLREMVAGGTIMSRIDTPEIYYNVQKIDPDHIKDVSYFKVPGRKTSGSGQGWTGLSISAKGNVDLAKDFIKYMFTGDTMTDFFVSYPYAMFPAKTDLFNDEKYRNGLPEELKKMVPDMALDILKTSSALTMANGPFPGAGEVESRMILGNALVMMLSKNATADQAVDYVASELKKLL